MKVLSSPVTTVLLGIFFVVSFIYTTIKSLDSIILDIGTLSGFICFCLGLFGMWRQIYKVESDSAYALRLADKWTRYRCFLFWGGWIAIGVSFFPGFMLRMNSEMNIFEEPQRTLFVTFIGLVSAGANCIFLSGVGNFLYREDKSFENLCKIEKK